ncbi:MAG: Vi polysaccharide biosynthesis protein VipB/TviC [Nitrospirae bacterium RBG_16_64_22]|nr:MAG: Vi polysaccharide biosynthesis protein VipB/TviC [Nitrospirae bacterium RBG_16_64_22]
MSVLVTGGAGFIGSNLVQALLERGDRVRVLDNFATGSRTNLAGIHPSSADRVALIEGDIRDQETCRSACRGVEVVYHQAALGSVPRSIEDPSTTDAVNIHGTVNIFSAAREAGVRRVVYASSSSVYGDEPSLPKVEGRIGRPLSPYALTKLTNERYADLFSSLYGMTLVGLRYFNIFGPRQSPDGPYAAVIPRFIQALLSKEAATINGDGEQSRDFTYVANAVQANIKAASADLPAGHHVFNVACGERFTLNELHRVLAGMMESPVPPVHGPTRSGDVRHSLADITAIQERLGYLPETDMEEGLRRTLDWFRTPPSH